MREFFRKNSLLVYPLIFALVLIPVMIVALISYQPSASADCNCNKASNAPPLAPHSHGTGLVSEVKNDMKLIFNVSAATQLYEMVDGRLQLCEGDLTGDMKHVTVDVLDAGLNVGEHLPVTVDLMIYRAGTSEIVIQAAAPAMVAPGHNYHFGDNYLLPSNTAYDWTVVISPVNALRQEGAQHLWLDPVEWSGSFELDASGAVIGKAAGIQLIGDYSKEGIHITLSHQDAVTLYDAEGTELDTEPNSRYFVVDVTDHAVNYESKLPGADVTLTFKQGSTAFDVVLPAVISPTYGFHYGANVPVEPGQWQITVTVGGLDFLRHAGSAVNLARRPVSGTFNFTVE
ncbi:MAG TPA: hypothetical protein VHP83_17515 [Aggregatilineaceae bacterium]|nr:hypothetical protein [Aggregatilineaceae bacterium]